MATTPRGTEGNQRGAVSGLFAVPPEILTELGRATTAYYEATPDRLEQSRQEYEEALRNFNATSELPRL